MALAEHATTMELEGLIGFNGTVPNGMCYTKCGKYVIYPLGAMVVVKSTTSDLMSFLEGHLYNVSCLSLSNCGNFLASGETAPNAGTKADVIIWDLKKAIANIKTKEGQASYSIRKLRIHMGKVEDLHWSCDDKFIATLGGVDDNKVTIWIVENGKPISGAPAGPDRTTCVRWLNNRNDRFVTGGINSLRVWAVDASIPKIHAMETKLGTLKRVFTCIGISKDDKVAYCGTKTGDVIRVRLDRDPIPTSFNQADKLRPLFDAISKVKFGKGVKSLLTYQNPATGNTNIYVGAGDGKIALLNPNMNLVAGVECDLMGSVTSICLHPDGSGLLAGTSQSNRYRLDIDLKSELNTTGHEGPINQVIFPKACPELFITCAASDIRVWNMDARQELIRIQVPNLECHCIDITGQGSTIVSGWSDGRVRGFLPESGKLKFVIPNAHHESVTALALCNDDEFNPPYRLVSGGKDGRVRMWNVSPSYQTMVFNAKDHRDRVNSIKVTKDNSQCISASADGSCIIWDLLKLVRIAAVVEPTVFKSVLYHPEESQILTASASFKIGYWDAYDGSPIRVVEGGNAAMNALDVTPDGEKFVSGGADRLVKLWEYDDGLVCGTGKGHSGEVSCVKFSPDLKKIVSVGKDGGIFIWKAPKV